jgi:BlaI family transcriptional regulator, penicillinase repressor
MKLSKAEEQIMEIIWQQGNPYFKDLLEAMPEPKPASSTIATMLKRMQDKGFVTYETHGNSRQYKALVKKEAYFKKHVNGMIENFFGNSAMEFASFFTTASNLSLKELEALKKIIDTEIKKKK